MGSKKSIITSPVGGIFYRLRGALFSGKRAAYTALLIKVLKPFTNIIDLLVNPLYGTRNLRPSVPPTIMIVSPPRAGATIIYQTIARILPSTYISNLHALFPTRASQLVIRKKGRIPLRTKNYYGYTSGMYDVYEGNEFIDPLFSKPGLSDDIKEKFSQLLRRINPTPTLPFVFKNARNFSNIKALSEAIPEVFFIRIRRDQEQVIQSELKAYQELKSFHPVPESLKNAGITDPLEFTVRQILEIDDEIDGQLQQIDPSRWIEWDYEAFCQDPVQMVSRLINDQLKMPEVQIRKENLDYNLKVSERKKVSEEEEKRIAQLISEIKKTKKL